MSLTATGSLLDPALAARGWLERAAELPDDGLTAWAARIGGQTIRFRCSDPELGQVYRSRLAGVDACPAPAELHFDLLETGRLGWPEHDARLGGPAGEHELIAHLRDAGLVGMLPPRGGQRDGGPAIVFEPAAGRGLVLVHHATALPPWASGAPFALLLHLAAAVQGRRLIHGAALGAGGRGVLLAGAGGTGKSGTTLAAVMRGMQTAGDDYVLLEPGEPPVARSVYRLLKQDPEGLARAGRPDLASQPVNWHGKVELDLDTAFPGSRVDALALRSILLPELAAVRRTTLHPVSPTEAFSAAAGSMLAQLPGARLSGFSFLTRLTRQLPAFRLRLSSDVEDIADALGRHLA